MQVLCGMTDSAPARNAARVAATLAARIGAELRLLHVGRPASAGTGLAEAARDADLLVIGASRRGPLGRTVLGDLGSSLLGAVRCPLVLVPAGARRPTGRSVLLACDVAAGPGPSAAAAGRLARAMGAALVVVHVQPERPRRGRRSTGWERHHGARRVRRAARAGAGAGAGTARTLPVEVVDRRGDRLEEVARAAEQHDAALVVVGRGRRIAGRGGVPRLALEIAATTGRPVMVPGTRPRAV